MFLILIVALTILYPLYLYIQRVHLSPLRHIPGSRLAIWTFWYEFYHDVIRDGRYTFHLPALHAKYGPIIRINPYEVHIDDFDFYDSVYVAAAKRRTEQWIWAMTMFGAPDSVLATVDHDVHRRRRGAYANFFSKGRIRQLSGVVVQELMEKLCERIEHYGGGKQQQKKKINLLHAWTAFTGDVVTTYCFPKGYGLLDKADFSPDYYEFWMGLISQSHVLKQFPWLFPLMLSFPTWFVDRYLPDLAVTCRWHQKWKGQIGAIQARMREGTEQEKGQDEKKEKDGREVEEQRASIFETLLDSDLPPQDKSVDRLVQDAQTFVGAGSITTSTALTLATYHILSTPGVESTLLSELRAAMPDPDAPLLPSVELEKLTYLSAIVLESLRISYGVCHRLQRVFPTESLTYKNYVIPPSTPISMSSLLIHDNPSIFPEPRSFQPERWLPLETRGKELQKYLVAFSRGSRQYLGMHLGFAELYVGIAGVFRRFGARMRVVDTDYKRDVEFERDWFGPVAGKGSRGIFIEVEGKK